MSTLPPKAQVPVGAIPASPPRRRILVLSRAKRHTRVTAHLIRGFRENGHEVLWLHWSKIRAYLGRRLGQAWVRRRVQRFRPDLALVCKGGAAPALLTSVLASVPRAGLYVDLFEECGAESLEIFRHCSVLFTTARGDVPKFEQAGVPRVVHIRRGCDLRDHFPVAPDPAWAGDVAFIGTANLPGRVELMRAIAGRHSLQLYGRGWQETFGRRARRRHVYPKHYRKICASTKILIGIDKRDDLDLYFSSRTWLTLGCGGFLLTRYVPHLEEFFTNHEHLVWFRSTDECLELIDHYLPREDDRRRIAAAGCEYVRTYHTYRHATAEIVDTVFKRPRP